MIKANRLEIFNAIERERYYQDEKIIRKGWNPNKSVMEFIAVMEAELQEAKDAWIKEGDARALEELLQVVAVGIAAMEIHGVKERANYYTNTPVLHEGKL